jgi:hypothetical protein
MKGEKKMKIDNKIYNNCTTFDELGCGDVFIYRDEVCMKTDGGDNKSNAVSLESGYLMHFFGGDDVRVVTATLTVE